MHGKQTSALGTSAKTDGARPPDSPALSMAGLTRFGSSPSPRACDTDTSQLLRQESISRSADARGEHSFRPIHRDDSRTQSIYPIRGHGNRDRGIFTGPVQTEPPPGASKD